MGRVGRRGGCGGSWRAGTRCARAKGWADAPRAPPLPCLPAAARVWLGKLPGGDASSSCGVGWGGVFVVVWARAPAAAVAGGAGNCVDAFPAPAPAPRPWSRVCARRAAYAAAGVLFFCSFFFFSSSSPVPTPHGRRSWRPACRRHPPPFIPPPPPLPHPTWGRGRTHATVQPASTAATDAAIAATAFGRPAGVAACCGSAWAAACRGSVC